MEDCPTTLSRSWTFMCPQFVFLVFTGNSGGQNRLKPSNRVRKKLLYHHLGKTWWPSWVEVVCATPPLKHDPWLYRYIKPLCVWMTEQAGSSCVSLVRLTWESRTGGEGRKMMTEEWFGLFHRCVTIPDSRAGKKLYTAHLDWVKYVSEY